MRIALVCDWYPPRRGGIETHLSELGRRLAAAGHEVHVVTTTRADGTAENVGVTVHRVDARLLPGVNVLYTPAGARSLGRAIDALRQDEVLAGSMGISILGVKVFMLMIASMVGAMSGVLYSRYTGFLDPTQFGLALMTQLFAFVVLGGTGSLWGPLVGAAFLSFALQFLTFAGNQRYILFGLVLIAVMLLRSEGVVPRSLALRKRRLTRYLEFLPKPATSAGAEEG